MSLNWIGANVSSSKTPRNPTQLIVYPDEHHGVSKLSHIKDRLDRYLEWYRKYFEE